MKKAVVVFSGGQDSTTCLYWAKKKFDEVEAVFFDYGQIHKIEKKSALKIAKLADVKIKCLSLPAFKQIGGSSLTDKKLKNPKGAVDKTGIPVSFVPGRNLIFISFAAAYAYTKKIEHIVTGVCQTDFSNYPDCRLTTIKALEKTINLGMNYKFKIHAPLMHLNKADAVKLAEKIDAYDALAFSHTCYNGQFPPCGNCPACILRANGFKQSGKKDPLVIRSLNIRNK